jgi:hypothetical protein
MSPASRRLAALAAEGIGGTEAHVLHALSEVIPAEKLGRVAAVRINEPGERVIVPWPGRQPSHPGELRTVRFLHTQMLGAPKVQTHPARELRMFTRSAAGNYALWHALT